MKYVLGSGSFGVVTFAEYTDVNTKKITYYALKSLSKATVIETGIQRRQLLIYLFISSTLNLLQPTSSTFDKLSEKHWTEILSFILFSSVVQHAK